MAWSGNLRRCYLATEQESSNAVLECPLLGKQAESFLCNAFLWLIKFSNKETTTVLLQGCSWKNPGISHGKRIKTKIKDTKEGRGREKANMRRGRGAGQRKGNHLHHRLDQDFKIFGKSYHNMGNGITDTILFPSVLAVVQLPSHVWLFMTPWTVALEASLSLTISWSFPKFMSIASVMPSSHLSHPLCPFLLLPSIFPRISVFSNESALCVRWPKYWSFSFNISPSNEYSGLISFKIDWLDILVVQGTLKSLLQHHSSKAWIFILFPISKTATLAICYFLIRSLKLS